MKDWESFIDEILAGREKLKLKTGEKCYYRGHCSSAWPLAPSLFRLNKDAEDARKLEYDLFLEFSSHARQLHFSVMDGWEILFQMRHHAIPTRLLDWTEVFGIALYFAIRDYRPEDKSPPCIWLLNPYRLNKKHWFGWHGLLSPKYLGSEPDTEDFYDYEEFLANDWEWGWENPVAITPALKSDRMHAQRCCFTIHGENSLPLEKTCKNFVHQVVIPETVIGDARNFLTLAGIDEYLLFPDLDGLSRSMNSKYL